MNARLSRARTGTRNPIDEPPPYQLGNQPAFTKIITQKTGGVKCGSYFVAIDHRMRTLIDSETLIRVRKLYVLGNGDSYHAAVAARFAFLSRTGLEYHAVPAVVIAMTGDSGSPLAGITDTVVDLSIPDLERPPVSDVRGNPLQPYGVLPSLWRIGGALLRKGDGFNADRSA